MTVAPETIQWLEKLKASTMEMDEANRRWRADYIQSEKRKAAKLEKEEHEREERQEAWRRAQAKPEIKIEAVVAPIVKTKRDEERKVQWEIYERHRKAGWIYLMRSENGYCKIGISKNVRTRAWELKRQFPILIEVIHQVACHDYRKVEKLLHEKYSAKRAEFEWFTLDAEDVKWLISLKDYELG